MGSCVGGISVNPRKYNNDELSSFKYGPPSLIADKNNGDKSAPPTTVTSKSSQALSMIGPSVFSTISNSYTKRIPNI